MSETAPAERIFRVLAIDGGGIRGIYPAAWLAAAENRVGSIGAYFDLVCGTSTGGIIALALGLGIPASTVLELYKSRGAAIFRRRRWTFGGLLGPIYGSEILGQALHEAFGERLLGESRNRLCIPAVDLATGKPKVYKTNHDPEFHVDKDLPAWKVALATSAAPVFFPAFEMCGSDALADGGLWANNPSLVGVVEARRLGFDLSDVRVLSVSTGEARARMSPRAARRGGYLQYAPKALLRKLACLGLKGARTTDLFSLLISLQSQTVDNQMRQIGVGAYTRVTTDFGPEEYPLDGYREALELEARATQSTQEELTAVCKEYLYAPAQAWHERDTTAVGFTACGAATRAGCSSSGAQGR